MFSLLVLKLLIQVAPWAKLILFIILQTVPSFLLIFCQILIHFTKQQGLFIFWVLILLDPILQIQIHAFTQENPYQRLVLTVLLHYSMDC